VQIPTGDSYVRMPRRITDLGKGSSTRERMTNDSVPLVKDRQPIEPLDAEHLARRAKTFAEREPR
jgi:hypothetical protein